MSLLEADVWDPAVGRAGLSPGRVDGRPRPESPRGPPSMCLYPDRLFLWGPQSYEVKTQPDAQRLFVYNSMTSEFK